MKVAINIALAVLATAGVVIFFGWAMLGQILYYGFLFLVIGTALAFQGSKKKERMATRLFGRPLDIEWPPESWSTWMPDWIRTRIALQLGWGIINQTPLPRDPMTIEMTKIGAWTKDGSSFITEATITVKIFDFYLFDKEVGLTKTEKKVTALVAPIIRSEVLSHDNRRSVDVEKLKENVDNNSSKKLKEFGLDIIELYFTRQARGTTTVAPPTTGNALVDTFFGLFKGIRGIIVGIVRGMLGIFIKRFRTEKSDLIKIGGDEYRTRVTASFLSIISMLLCYCILYGTIGVGNWLTRPQVVKTASTSTPQGINASPVVVATKPVMTAAQVTDSRVKSWDDTSRGGGIVIEDTIQQGEDKDPYRIPISPRGWISAWPTDGPKSQFQWGFVQLDDEYEEITYVKIEKKGVVRYSPTETAYVKISHNGASGTGTITFRFAFKE